MNRPAFFDSVGDRLAGLIRHGILADERPEEPRRIDDDLSAPLGSSRQAGDAASRSRSIARSAALRLRARARRSPGARISAIGDGVMCNVTPLIPDH
jgi:hypothetical protein